MNKILVVDYNAGNVDSVIKAIKIFNANVIFSKNLADLNNCSKIILPGQGTYDVAIKELKENGFYEKIIHKKKQRKYSNSRNMSGNANFVIIWLRK